MIRDTSGQDQPLAHAHRPGRRWLWGGLALGLVALLAWAVPNWLRGLSGGTSVSLSRLSVAAVEVGPLVRDVAAEGKVVAAVSPTLYAANAGSISLLAKAGDSVKRGQPLLRIASPELQAKAAQERSNADALHSDWLRAQADVRQQHAQAESALALARIEQQTAVNELARQTRAFEAGATAQAQVDQARDALARAEVALKQAQQLLGLKDEATRFELQAKRQAFERQQLVVADMTRQLGELEVRSPVDGQVGQLFVSERESVAKDAKLLTVIDLSALEVQVQVAESYARELQTGMPGEISGNGQRWPGRVSSVSPEVVANEVAARLRFDGAQPEQLRQNQRLSVRVLLDQRDKVLKLARGAFVDESGGRFAYVVRDGQAERRAIRLGAQSLSAVEVLDGLKAGDQVVISGAEQFKGAERVTLIP
ncbi:efflux RND transporter periplasmic adaptor subunit [Ideonella margarita]|uniref:Efflux RND transporter periplasmic adaptor subunit n=1 Tax=Ideonella margarita TaxID=2984191 RepID=A0ABU9C3B1_9BURK